MTNTERKLDEARYFYGQLNIDDPYFDYVLSAYLNASRSTTWIMRHEFNKVEGWEDWFRDCAVSDGQRELLTKINELRLVSKQFGIKTDYYLFDEIIIDEQYYSIVKEFLKTDGEFKLTIRSVDEPEDDNEEDEEDSFYDEKFVFKGRIDRTQKPEVDTRKEIYKLCTDYFDFLEEQTNECVAKFGNIGS